MIRMSILSPFTALSLFSERQFYNINDFPLDKCLSSFDRYTVVRFANLLRNGTICYILLPFYFFEKSILTIHYPRHELKVKVAIAILRVLSLVYRPSHLFVFSKTPAGNGLSPTTKANNSQASVELLSAMVPPNQMIFYGHLDTIKWVDKCVIISSVSVYAFFTSENSLYYYISKASAQIRVRFESPKPAFVAKFCYSEPGGKVLGAPRCYRFDKSLAFTSISVFIRWDCYKSHFKDTFRCLCRNYIQYMYTQVKFLHLI